MAVICDTGIATAAAKLQDCSSCCHGLGGLGWFQLLIFSRDVHILDCFFLVSYSRLLELFGGGGVHAALAAIALQGRVCLCFVGC